MCACGIVLGLGLMVQIGIRKRNCPMVKKMCWILILTAVLGIMAGAVEWKNTSLDEEGRFERNPNGEGDYEAELVLNIDGLVSDYDYTVMVPEQKLTTEEEEAYLKAAEEEIDQTFPGENESLNEIRDKVVIRETYQNGKVAADWSFGDYDIMDFTGDVIAKDIPEEGELVWAQVELTCEDSYRNYTFYFRVFPLERTVDEKVIEKLNEELTKEGEIEGENSLKIPDKIENYELSWQEKRTYMPEKLLFMGILAVAGIPLSEKSKKEEQKKKREQLLQMEYPDMVSKLTLLMGAGMTLFSAWKRITTDYCDERKKFNDNEMPVYEEMLITCREIESGMGEAKAYTRFGERCGLRRYRKFSSLLVQNLKKGSSGLTGLLAHEAEDAFEERKSIARKLGEEAGTKLLFPMILMLGIVIAILMVPAIISFQM